MLLCLHQSEGRTDVIIWSRGRRIVKGRDLSRGWEHTCILLCFDWLVCYAPLLASVWRLHWCDNLVKGVGTCQGGGDLSRGWELTCILLCLDWLVCYAPLLASVWSCTDVMIWSRGQGLVKGAGTYLYSSLLRLASMLCSTACISLKAALMW